MKESFRKGIANHPDIDPCDGGGNDALEACGAHKARARGRHWGVEDQACMGTSRARTDRPCCYPQPVRGGSVGEGAHGVRVSHSGTVEKAISGGPRLFPAEIFSAL